MFIKIKYIFKLIYSFLMDNFHQSQHFGYRLLKRGYILYQHEVVKQGKTFGLYARDYLAEIQNFNYKTEKELSDKTRIHTRVSDIFSLRPDLIKQYFSQNDFVFTDYRNLVQEYDISIIEEEIIQPLTTTEENEAEQPSSGDLEEKLAKVRAEILKYESGDKLPKHIGQRMFGYLLKARYFTAYKDELRLAEWQKFTGLDTKPEMSYLRDPDSNKNGTPKINQQLKTIEEFFYLIGLNISVRYYEPKKFKK